MCINCKPPYNVDTKDELAKTCKYKAGSEELERLSLCTTNWDPYIREQIRSFKKSTIFTISSRISCYEN